jgi:hypothetical protein
LAAAVELLEQGPAAATELCWKKFKPVMKNEDKWQLRSSFSTLHINMNFLGQRPSKASVVSRSDKEGLLTMESARLKCSLFHRKLSSNFSLFTQLEKNSLLAAIFSCKHLQQGPDGRYSTPRYSTLLDATRRN